MNEKALTPIEQKEVAFYDDQLTAVRADDGRVYASLRHMCQALGIDDQGQRQRINRHTVLSKGLMVCKLHTIQGYRDSYVLRADLVPLWLSGIRTKSVNEEAKPKLEKFQEEAAVVLWEAFQDGRLTSDTAYDELLQSDNDAAVALRIAEAVVRLARHQLLLEATQQQHGQRLDSHETRLEEIEAAIAPGTAVSEDQASQISQAVKAVAMTLGKQTKRNEFGAVYGEVYRKFEVTSYKMVPQGRFDEVMKFLTEWHQSLVADSPF